MNKQEIYKLIKSKNIWYEITEHKAVYNMEELKEIDIPYPKYDAKNYLLEMIKKETIIL